MFKQAVGHLGRASQLTHGPITFALRSAEQLSPNVSICRGREVSRQSHPLSPIAARTSSSKSGVRSLLLGFSLHIFQGTRLLLYEELLLSFHAFMKSGFICTVFQGNSSKFKEHNRHAFLFQCWRLCATQLNMNHFRHVLINASSYVFTLPRALFWFSRYPLQTHFSTVFSFFIWLTCGRSIDVLLFNRSSSSSVPVGP